MVAYPSYSEVFSRLKFIVKFLKEDLLYGFARKDKDGDVIKQLNTLGVITYSKHDVTISKERRQDRPKVNNFFKSLMISINIVQYGYIK